MTLKLVHSEAQMDLYRKAEILTITERLANRDSKIAMLKERLEDIRRQLNDEKWAKSLDQNRLSQLQNNRAKPIIPPLESGIEE